MATLLYSFTMSLDGVLLGDGVRVLSQRGGSRIRLERLDDVSTATTLWSRVDGRNRWSAVRAASMATGCGGGRERRLARRRRRFVGLAGLLVGVLTATGCGAVGQVPRLRRRHRGQPPRHLRS